MKELSWSQLSMLISLIDTTLKINQQHIKNGNLQQSTIDCVNGESYELTDIKTTLVDMKNDIESKWQNEDEEVDIETAESMKDFEDLENNKSKLK